MIETICSNCGNRRVFEDSNSGKKFKCPECGNVVEIKPLLMDEKEEEEKLSNTNHDAIVQKQLQKLFDMKKTALEQKEKRCVERELENAQIQERVDELKKQDLEKYLSERKIYRIFLLIYLSILFSVFFLRDAIETYIGENFLSLLGLLALVGWIPVVGARTSVKEFREMFFGDNPGTEFSKAWESSTRNKVRSSMYFVDPKKDWEHEQALDKIIQRIDKNIEILKSQKMIQNEHDCS